MYERPDWKTYFLDIADAVGARATCTRDQIGAVIVDPLNRIIGTGYNGAPRKHGHCIDGHCPRGKKSFAEIPSNAPYTGDGACIAIHAEHNAILNCLIPIPVGCTLYCSRKPCPQCEQLLNHVGIERRFFRRVIAKPPVAIPPFD